MAAAKGREDDDILLHESIDKLAASTPSFKTERDHNNIELHLSQTGLNFVYNISPRPSSHTNSHSNLVASSGHNPQATFLKLPRELRLEIYDWLFPSRLTHISFSRTSVRGLNPGTSWKPQNGRYHYGHITFSALAPPRFYFRPCRAVDRKNPQLCLRPPWPEVHYWEGVCCSSTCHVRYSFGIAGTSKQIRQDVLHHVMRRVSMSTCTLELFQTHMSDYMRHIQYLTITPDKTPCDHERCPSEPSLSLLNNVIKLPALPSLRAVAFSSRLSEETFSDVFKEIAPSQDAHDTAHEPERGWLETWKERAIAHSRLPNQISLPVLAEWWVVIEFGSGSNSSLKFKRMLRIRSRIDPQDSHDHEKDELNQVQMELLDDPVKMPIAYM